MAQRDRILAVLIHARRYRERSQVADLLTCQDLRVGCLFRTAPTPYGVIQPFCLLSLILAGQGELYTAFGQEELETLPLTPKAMICGLYLNELVQRLTVRHSPVAGLFALYWETLKQLADDGPKEAPLRRFEQGMLMALGYGLALKHEAGTGRPLEGSAYYRFVPDYGLRRSKADEAGTASGETLTALAADRLTTPRHLQEAKRFLRAVLGHYLGPRPLVTRKLWV